MSGDGGHNVNTLVRAARGKAATEPNAGDDVRYLEGKNSTAKVKHLILAKYDDHNYGYLRIHVDRQYLKIGFHQVGVRSLAQSRYDMVTVRTWRIATWSRTRAVGREARLRSTKTRGPSRTAASGG